MIYDKNRQKATVGTTGICPECDEILIAKCGDLNIHHWAHKVSNNCSSLGETPWHYNWKQRFPDDLVERVVRKGGLSKRADVLLPSGHALEFQHSTISYPEIQLREKFYCRMVWVFDVSGSDFEFEELPPKSFSKPGDIVYSFRWKWAKRTVMLTNKLTFYDFGNIMFVVKKVSKFRGGVYGYGRFVTHNSFMETSLKGVNLTFIRIPAELTNYAGQLK